MASRDKRFDSMLFNYETTGRTDFRDGRIRPIIKTVYKEKGSCLRIRPRPLKDIHALTDWYEPSVPFNLMHKPKEIVQTHPQNIQARYSEPEDLEREEVQRTRPRLVMTPAVSYDDIEPHARKLLLTDVYSSTLQLMHREAGIDTRTGVRAPAPPLAAPANPISLQKLRPPMVSPEWRKETVQWDNRQLRAHCHATKEFWLKLDLPKCNVCDETAVIKAHRDMLRKRK